MWKGKQLYIEVSTLLDPNWSGIANVTANICRVLLSQGQSVHFFAFDKVLKTAYVLNALRAMDGVGLRILYNSGNAVSCRLSDRTRTKDGDIAIFPNFKRAYQSFDVELLIVHDISFVLTPEFHDPGLVKDYTRRLARNIYDVDRVVCVSHATRRDLITYYNVAPEKVTVSHLGARIAALDNAFNKKVGGIEPSCSDYIGAGNYFLMLGTIEPRKNLTLVLDYIQANPTILNTYRFVFAGRDGWGTPFNKSLAARRLGDARIIHLGYVDEQQRTTLLKGCSALLFPSWFEGFGLPVLEAMSHGIPVIGSRSSGIVEAGGAPMIGFDPGSLRSFSNAIMHFQALSESEIKALTDACIIHSNLFTWERFVDGLLGAIE